MLEVARALLWKHKLRLFLPLVGFNIAIKNTSKQHQGVHLTRPHMWSSWGLFICKYEQEQLHCSFLTLTLLKKSEYCPRSVNDLSLLVIIQTYLNTAGGRLNFQVADPDQIFWRRLMREWNRNDGVCRHLDIRYGDFLCWFKMITMLVKRSTGRGVWNTSWVITTAFKTRETETRQQTG